MQTTMSEVLKCGYNFGLCPQFLTFPNIAFRIMDLFPSSWLFLHDSFFTKICNDLCNHKLFLMEAKILHGMPNDIFPFPHNLRPTALLYNVCLVKQEIRRRGWMQRLSNQTEQAFASLPEHRLFRPLLWTSFLQYMTTNYVNTVLFLILNNHATAGHNIVLNNYVKCTINK
jgi:hypothetical protein